MQLLKRKLDLTSISHNNYAIKRHLDQIRKRTTSQQPVETDLQTSQNSNTTSTLEQDMQPQADVSRNRRERELRPRKEGRVIKNQIQI